MLWLLPAIGTVPTVAVAQPHPRQVWALIAAPGTAPNTWFGHGAVVIDDPGAGPQVFHYGSFSNGSETVRGVITGHPIARMRVTTLRRALAEFEEAGRSVDLLELALSASQVRDLLHRLEHDFRTIGSTGYAYDVMDDGCATRIRDLLDAVLGGALRAQGGPHAARSFRSTAFGYIQRESLSAAIIADALTNDRLDVPSTEFAQAAFPRELGVLLERTRAVDGASSAPLVIRRDALYRGAERIAAPPQPPGALALFAASSACAILLLFVRGIGRATPLPHRLRFLGAVSALLALLIGGLGAVIASAWLFTEYPFAPFNENLLLLNPLALLLVVPGIAHATGATSRSRLLRPGWSLLAVSAAVAVAAKAAPAFDQHNWRLIALALPVLAGMAVCWRASPARPLAAAPLSHPARRAAFFSHLRTDRENPPQ